MSLYNPRDVRDNCGFGLIAHTEGKPSHRVIRLSVQSLARMQHRGGIAADGKTGDGCGLLLQLPDSYFRQLASEQGWQPGKRFGIGMLFLSRDADKAAAARAVMTEELERETLTVHGWREVPVNPDILGEIARETQPQIEQVFVSAPQGWRKMDMERRLYMARRRAEQRLGHDDDFYCASLSNLVVIYKGLVMAADLPAFYHDLADLRMETGICVFHQRFSTNTQPRWPLAQPFRFLAHNGEINTITGNRAWARARAYKFSSPLLPDLQQVAPFINESGSDSSSLDNMLELLMAGGMDLFRAMRMLVPPAWQNDPRMDDELRAFYEFNSLHMEPWDGPAGIVMTNGRHAACNLDRNGLRPARYVLTRDKLLTIASEVGVWDYTPDEVIEKGRVGPGQMLAIDTETGKLWQSDDIDQELKSRHPYRQWLSDNATRLKCPDELGDAARMQRTLEGPALLATQKLFGITREEQNDILRVLGENGAEAVGSMGDDAPFAVLSEQPRPVFDYFRQKFAQVTNPPIDPLRENFVMSLATLVGHEQNVFSETSGFANRISFSSPMLTPSGAEQLLSQDQAHYRTAYLSLGFSPAEGAEPGQSLQQALTELCNDAERLVRQGAVLLVLSDKQLGQQLPVPAALAVGAVQQRLIQADLRCDSNLIVETGSARDPHQIAVLIGLGATAVYPYLAYETLVDMADRDQISVDSHQAVLNYRQGINKGLHKILSKMGISTIASYRSAMLFEIVGIGQPVMDLCFSGVKSRLQGSGFADFEQDVQRQAALARRPRKPIGAGGQLKYVHGEEYHAYNPDVIQSLQMAVNSGRWQDYQRYAEHVNQRPAAALRDLLKLTFDSSRAIPVDEVEADSALFQRFDSAAMSIGALSPEAHEALAIAMNRLGGRSNSGEGGEDPSRFGNLRNSKIKQVASGRFGVTPHYLSNAEVIQIKVAQGAKPGEGGQLPGGKVTVQIARLRYSVPGVTLISPPPHHDIYSIEDLAQLIFDLKQVNPGALISVKLVSGPGIGTIATGVAKAYADLITVSGYDGGTGASPLTSVKYAGTPWEIGLAEVHQALVSEGLRHKVRLQVDGGLKTGLDVIKATILGAESFGFGTGPMVALGCKYLRICHLNNCATGVATQDERLRRDHYKGLPERVENYFRFIAREMRELMAQCGVSQLTDLIGRTDLLQQLPGSTSKQQQLDLAPILFAPTAKPGMGLFCQQPNPAHDRGELNQQLIDDCQPAIDAPHGGNWHYTIANTDRSVGARISGYVAAKYGNAGMATTPLHLHFSGTAGQSFGVWNAGGINLSLTGDANDYVGKGMAGGQIAIRPHAGSTFSSFEAAIIGNTCLYGATGGKLYAAGRAGERFAVRNSGCIAVVEGLGDHGCEYMTGGIVTVLGAIGINFGAGMTGGFAYLLDENDDLDIRLNHELVEAHALDNLPVHQEHLRGQLTDHLVATDSERAREMLDNFDAWVAKFRLVKPKAAQLDQLLGHRQQSSAELMVQVQ